jgi:hypothetical protein
MNASAKTSSESMISIKVDNDKVGTIEDALIGGKDGFIMHYVTEQSKIAQIGVGIDVLSIEDSAENEPQRQQPALMNKRKSANDEQSLFPIRRMDKDSKTNFANRISVFLY